MNRRFLGIVLAVLLLMPLLVASCGDDKKTTEPPDEPELPELPEVEITQSVDFQSNDQTAQQAQGLVTGMLGAAAGIAATSNAYLQPLETADWSGQGEHCYTWTGTYEGCTAIYEVCETASGYEWTMTLNGVCGDETYSNWVLWRGTSNADGTSGSFYWYENNTTNVAGGWTWSMSANRKSGTWSFYMGALVEENLVATVDWTENADGSEDITWTNPGEFKWAAHIADGGRSGWFRTYHWDETTQQWLLQTEITWQIGTGSMTVYDDDGNVVTEESW